MVARGRGPASVREARSSRTRALIAKYAKDAPYNIAYVYAFRGEADQAFAWLDKAVEYQDSGISEIVPENLFANIHSDPHWLPFLRMVGKVAGAARGDQVRREG